MTWSRAPACDSTSPTPTFSPVATGTTSRVRRHGLSPRQTAVPYAGRTCRPTLGRRRSYSMPRRSRHRSGIQRQRSQASPRPRPQPRRSRATRRPASCPEDSLFQAAGQHEEGDSGRVRALRAREVLPAPSAVDLRLGDPNGRPTPAHPEPGGRRRGPPPVRAKRSRPRYARRV